MFCINVINVLIVNVFNDVITRNTEFNVRAGLPPRVWISCLYIFLCLLLACVVSCETRDVIDRLLTQSLAVLISRCVVCDASLPRCPLFSCIIHSHSLLASDIVL